MSYQIREMRDPESFPNFCIAYQPIVNVPARRVVAYEALVRGHHNMSYPQLTAGMCQRTLRQYHRMMAEEAIRAAVALGLAERKSSLTLNLQPDIDENALDPDFVRATAERFGLPSRRIVLEITEDQRLPILEMRKLIHWIRSSGFSVAIDDFGAGYAGLTAFVETHPEILKLDRELIQSIEMDEGRRKVVSAVVRIAASLRVVLVAEGVETLAECRTLRLLGIKLMQGYFFSKPVINELPRFEQCRGDGIHLMTRSSTAPMDSGLWSPAASNYAPCMA
jgi:EAL domain-containing protein (putative c-di-GMP-specific phosphodiesterase class I)